MDFEADAPFANSKIALDKPNSILFGWNFDLALNQIGIERQEGIFHQRLELLPSFFNLWKLFDNKFASEVLFCDGILKLFCAWVDDYSILRF